MKYTFQCTRKIESNRKENNSVLQLMKGKVVKCHVHTFRVSRKREDIAGALGSLNLAQNQVRLIKLFFKLRLVTALDKLLDKGLVCNAQLAFHCGSG